MISFFITTYLPTEDEIINNRKYKVYKQGQHLKIKIWGFKSGLFSQTLGC